MPAPVLSSRSRLLLEGSAERRLGRGPRSAELARRTLGRAGDPPGPNGVAMARAAVISIAFGTASRCLFARAQLKKRNCADPGGSHGVGLAAVQLASIAGANVLATGSVQRAAAPSRYMAPTTDRPDEGRRRGGRYREAGDRLNFPARRRGRGAPLCGNGNPPGVASCRCLVSQSPVASRASRL